MLIRSGYLRLLRPHQWIKSGFVLVGFVFHRDWFNLPLLGSALAAAVAFSLIASAVYIYNDFIDREGDRLHPDKQTRPMVTGDVVPWRALSLAAVLVVLALLLAATVAGTALTVILLAYLALMLAYCHGVRQVVILDVFVIATGFLLRLLAGTEGIGIAASGWLLICGIFLALFLGFAKRRAELQAVSGDSTPRRVLADYSPALLDSLIMLTGSGVMISYSLYTLSPDTVQAHGTDALLYTVPVVIYGLFRYLYLLHHRGRAQDTARDLLSDRHLLLTVLLWLALVIALLATPTGATA
ncbi:MAG TPA: decaprenyl-phosphate phosphoribosyltransferase [Xanthomonadales bacterium]|nr:decaprenyl-phosphate phosphoribosyltransferase [Xanthomonadales bacterium]